jgi:protease YdgD
MSKNFKRVTLAMTSFCASLFSLLPGTFQSAQAVVIGADNRVTPAYNWMLTTGRAGVGRLEVQRQDSRFYSCTVTMIGRNIGLTNAHCLLDTLGRAPKQIKAFFPQHGNRSVIVAANGDVYWSGLKVAPSKIGDRLRDWAIVRFNSNVGDRTGWYGYEGWYSNLSNAGKNVVGRPANLIGYSGDWPTAPAFRLGDIRGRTPGAHFGCTLPRIQSGLLLHVCDTTEGASGSALENGSRSVMGLHFGSVTSNGSTMNGAVPLERFGPAVQKLRATAAATNTIVPVP